jgi:hypothetical protein
VTQGALSEQGIVIFFYGEGNENHKLETGFLYSTE